MDQQSMQSPGRTDLFMLKVCQLPSTSLFHFLGSHDSIQRYELFSDPVTEEELLNKSRVTPDDVLRLKAITKSECLKTHCSLT